MRKFCCQIVLVAGGKNPGFNWNKLFGKKFQNSFIFHHQLNFLKTIFCHARHSVNTGWLQRWQGGARGYFPSYEMTYSCLTYLPRYTLPKLLFKWCYSYLSTGHSWEQNPCSQTAQSMTTLIQYERQERPLAKRSLITNYKMPIGRLQSFNWQLPIL